MFLRTLEQIRRCLGGPSFYLSRMSSDLSSDMPDDSFNDSSNDSSSTPFHSDSASETLSSSALTSDLDWFCHLCSCPILGTQSMCGKKECGHKFHFACLRGTVGCKAPCPTCHPPELEPEPEPERIEQPGAVDDGGFDPCFLCSQPMLGSQTVYRKKKSVGTCTTSSAFAIRLDWPPVLSARMMGLLRLNPKRRHTKLLFA